MPSVSSVVRLWSLTFRTGGELRERFHLGVREVAPSPQLQFRIPDRTDRNARQLIDRVPDCFEHVANLAVSPFMDSDLQRGVPVVAARQHAD